MGRFTRHLALGEKIVVDGEEFLLKPLSIDNISDFFEAMKAMSGAKNAEENPEEALKNMSTEGAQAIGRLIDETLKVSFPDESPEERKAFGLRFMAELMGKIFEINSALVSNPEVQAKIKALKDGNRKP